MESYPDQFIPEGIFIAIAPEGNVAELLWRNLAPKSKGMRKNGKRSLTLPALRPHRHLGLAASFNPYRDALVTGHGAGPINMETYGDSQGCG